MHERMLLDVFVTLYHVYSLAKFISSIHFFDSEDNSWAENIAIFIDFNLEKILKNTPPI